MEGYFVTCTRSMKSSLQLILLLTLLWIVWQSSLNRAVEAEYESTEYDKWQADNKQTCNAKGCPCIRKGMSEQTSSVSNLSIVPRPIQLKRVGLNVCIDVYSSVCWAQEALWENGVLPRDQLTKSTPTKSTQLPMKSTC